MTTNAPRLLAVRPQRGGFAPDAVSTVLVSGSQAVGGGGATGPLLYWSDTRFGSAFGLPLHRHEALETITVVLDGRSQHYDTDSRRWFDLAAGDVQVMHAGTGLSHAERVVDAARVLQLMIDPGPRVAGAAPSYADHRADAMPIGAPAIGVETTQVIGVGAPATSAGDLAVRRLRLQPGARVDLGPTLGRAALLLVLGGAVGVEGLAAAADQVVDVGERDGTALTASASAEVLLLTAPLLAPASRLL